MSEEEWWNLCGADHNALEFETGSVKDDLEMVFWKCQRSV